MKSGQPWADIWWAVLQHKNNQGLPDQDVTHGWGFHAKILIIINSWNDSNQDFQDFIPGILIYKNLVSRLQNPVGIPNKYECGGTLSFYIS